MRVPAARYTFLALTFSATLSATLPPAPLRAQGTSKPEHRTSRAKVLAVVGGIVGGVAGIVFAKSSSSDLGGSCLGLQCVIVAGTAGGAIFGYFIGREYDITYAQRYRGVKPLDISSVDSDLEGEPEALAANDSTISVAGSSGVQLFSSGAELIGQARRAGGLRGISVVALSPSTGWIALGSPSGLYLFPPNGGPGSLVRSGSVGAAAATDQRVYFGVDDRLEIAPFQVDTTREWPGIALDGGTARDVAVDSARSVVWVVTGRELDSYRVSGDSLVRLGSASLGGAGRRLALVHDTIAVAMGEAGVRLFDASDPAAPRAFADWKVARFVYDVSMEDGRLFAAAGPEGVYVVSLRGGTLTTLGLARGLGFASALVSRGGHTYILDRRSNSLRRIDSDF